MVSYFFRWGVDYEELILMCNSTNTTIYQEEFDTSLYNNIKHGSENWMLT